MVAVIQLVPAALLAPFFAQLADRLPRQRVLLGACAGQAVTLALTAATMRSNAPLWIVYGSATLAAIAMTLTCPIVGAMMPGLVRTPDELTAGNVVSGWIESVGLLVGPAEAGLLRYVGSGARLRGRRVSLGGRGTRDHDDPFPAPEPGRSGRRSWAPAPRLPRRIPRSPSGTRRYACS